MNDQIQSLKARVVLGVFAGVLGAFCGLILEFLWTYPDVSIQELPDVWMIIGAVVGFAIGAFGGNVTSAGPTANLIAGVVAGGGTGAFLGWIWSRIVFSAVRRRLLDDGLPADFLNASKIGLFDGTYEAIGLRYGIVVGILSGIVVAMCWSKSLRTHRPKQFVVAGVFSVVLTMIVLANRRFDQTSNRDFAAMRTAWSQRFRERWERIRDNF
jgi:hypothetical protein